MSSRYTPAITAAREAQSKQRRATDPETKALGGVVLSVDGRSETIQYLNSVSSTNFAPVTHPYVGGKSWIRVMPEAGTGVMLQKRGDMPSPFISTYTNDGEPAARVTVTEETGEDVYRGLQPGEFDILSTGRAYLHGSTRGTLNLRGGMVHATLSSDQLEIQMRAPTHKIEAFGFRRGVLANSKRFGVVKRPTPTTTGATPSGTPTVYERPIFTVPTGSAGEWALEHTVNLTPRGGTDPLIDIRQGRVYKDDGTEPTHPDTGNKLRAHGQWGTTTSGDIVHLYLDEQGNCAIQFPPVARTGMLFDVQGGGFELKSKGVVRITGQDALRVELSGEMEVRSRTSVTLDAATQITAKAPTVVLDAAITRAGGATATLPVALAGGSAGVTAALLQLINTLTVAAAPGPVIVNPASLAAYTAAVSANAPSTTLFAR